MNLFYVSYGLSCGLVAAKNLRNAKRNVLRQHGTDNVSLVRVATQKDVDYITMFGGHVPNGDIAARGRKS